MKAAIRFERQAAAARPLPSSRPRAAKALRAQAAPSTEGVAAQTAPAQLGRLAEASISAGALLARLSAGCASTNDSKGLSGNSAQPSS